MMVIYTMLEWARIIGFDWDAENARKSSRKHGVSQAEAEQIFFNSPLCVIDDSKHSATEQRFHALGETDQYRKLHVTFTLRSSGTRIRVISARDMHRKERTIYESTDVQEARDAAWQARGGTSQKGGSGVQE
jgi:hypothetical protein